MITSERIVFKFGDLVSFDADVAIFVEYSTLTTARVVVWYDVKGPGNRGVIEDVPIHALRPMPKPPGWLRGNERLDRMVRDKLINISGQISSLEFHLTETGCADNLEQIKHGIDALIANLFDDVECV